MNDPQKIYRLIPMLSSVRKVNINPLQSYNQPEKNIKSVVIRGIPSRTIIIIMGTIKFIIRNILKSDFTPFQRDIIQFIDEPIAVWFTVPAPRDVSGRVKQGITIPTC